MSVARIKPLAAVAGMAAIGVAVAVNLGPSTTANTVAGGSGDSSMVGEYTSPAVNPAMSVNPTAMSPGGNRDRLAAQGHDGDRGGDSVPQGLTRAGMCEQRAMPVSARARTARARREVPRWSARHAPAVSPCRPSSTEPARLRSRWTRSPTMPTAGSRCPWRAHTAAGPHSPARRLRCIRNRSRETITPWHRHDWRRTDIVVASTSFPFTNTRDRWLDTTYLSI